MKNQNKRKTRTASVIKRIKAKLRALGGNCRQADRLLPSQARSQRSEGEHEKGRSAAHQPQLRLQLAKLGEIRRTHHEPIINNSEETQPAPSVPRG